MSVLKIFAGNMFAKLMTVLFTAFFSINSLSTGVCRQPPETPDDFTPVLRFSVCSDIHLSGEEDDVNAKEFRELFTQSYELASSDEKYDGLDAVMVCGDMTEWGREKEYSMYNRIVSEELREGTAHLSCMGNHEFIEARETEGVDPFKNYREYVSESFDTHTVINGYHFIGLSYSDKDENYDESKIQWLKEQLDEAVADTGDKPIFVFQHPHPTLTVYGSIHWSEIKITSVLSKYPQVIDFSGHSHYASTDPRSIWQGTFTAVGTGAVTGLIGNINYLDGDAGTTIPSASYDIVEVDAEGNVRIRIFDAYSDMFYPENDYYLPLSSDSSNRYYSWGNSKSFDSKPLFEEGEISAEVNADGQTIISFPDAKGYYDAVSYNITVKTSYGKTVFASSVLSEYVSAVNDGMTVNAGILEKGTYKVIITPVSPYAKTGEILTGSFEI